MSCKNMDYREFKKETHRLTPLGLLLAKHIRFHANNIGVCWEHGYTATRSHRQRSATRFA